MVVDIKKICKIFTTKKNQSFIKKEHNFDKKKIASGKEILIEIYMKPS